MTTRHAHLEITGMSCATCSGSIEDAVGALEGVETASANFATDEGTVAYDPEVVTLEQIVDTIEDAGFEIDERYQTVFGTPAELEDEEIREGHGEGLFAVISASPSR